MPVQIQLSSIVQVDSDNRPHAEVKIKGIPLIGLLDSGAQLTVIGSKFGHDINHLKIKLVPSLTIVRTADGTPHQSCQNVTLPFEFNGRVKNLEVVYCPTLPKSLILGYDFWKLFSIKPIVCESMEIVKQVPVCENHIIDEDGASKLQNALKQMPFAKDGHLSQTSLISHNIDTGDAKPIKQRMYCISPHLQKDVNAEIDRLLKLDVIYKCEPSPWSNPIVVVKKPNGKVRLCLDARKLNNVTKKDAYPQPQINRILGCLSGTKYLSSIDFSDAFLQVPLDEESRAKTAFAVSGRGYFAYKRMAFGLCNSGATLCRLVDQIIGCDLEPNVFVYLDDIIIATSSFDEHVKIINEVALRLSNAGLTVSSEKSRFCMSRLKYLGYIISGNGIEPDPEKVRAIVEYPTPKSIKDIRRLLGMAGWYRRFLRDFASVAAPISNMLKKSKSKFAWSEEADLAFQSLKTSLTSSPVLANPDYSKPFIIQTDASNFGIGAVLVQGEGEAERVIAYLSQKLTSTQQKYQTTERECLAVITAIEKFRPYIEGSRFKVVTDHASLQWLQNLKDPSGRLGRWALRLQPYDYEIVHRKGNLMVVPDALSRSVDMIDTVLFATSTDKWYNELVQKVDQDPIKYPQFQIMNGILYKHCARSSSKVFTNSTWRIVIPKDFRETILNQSHNDPLSAHGGFYKTSEKVRRKYFWPDMINEIRSYVNKCDICKAVKHSNKNQTSPMGKMRESRRPWQLVFIDLIGPLPRSKNGFKHVFVVIDSFSKFVRVKPLREATAKSIVDFLKAEVFLTFGVPEIVISDNGKQFVSNEFKILMNQFMVKTWYTAKYHPQANAVEAANKTLETSIRAYIGGNDDHNNWDKYLYEIVCSMNTSIHTATKHTPYLVNFGHEMITCGESYATTNPDGSYTFPDPPQIKKIREIVKTNLKISYEQRKQRYDLRARPIEYKVGEVVWRRNFILSNKVKNICAKLAPNYSKSIIIKKLGSNSYEVGDENGKSCGVYSAKDIKKDGM